MEKAGVPLVPVITAGPGRATLTQAAGKSVPVGQASAARRGGKRVVRSAVANWPPPSSAPTRGQGGSAMTAC